ncbi:hypothetical protein DFJ73DRAFT_121192 [Zopfochytrium polystomum]|nr:hypothetical protein DFJ73DRAFT_121192 [Zopfochytrium polystomum]
MGSNSSQQQQYTPQTSASSTRSLNNPSTSQFNVSATAASAPIPSYESLVASGATSAPARRSSIEKRPLNSASSATNSISYAGQPQRLNINGMPAGTASGVPPSPAPSGSIAPSISSSTASAPLVMRVLHPYAPTLNDELELVVGQEVIVLRAFDDGWGLGTTPSNGAQGAFPLVCVTSGVGSETGSVVSDALSSLAPEDREKQYRLSAMIQKGAKRESSIVR